MDHNTLWKILKVAPWARINRRVKAVCTAGWVGGGGGGDGDRVAGVGGSGLLVWTHHGLVSRDAQHAPAGKEFWARGQCQYARLFLSS